MGRGQRGLSFIWIATSGIAVRRYRWEVDQVDSGNMVVVALKTDVQVAVA